jgi:hypothetical protein
MGSWQPVGTRSAASNAWRHRRSGGVRPGPAGSAVGLAQPSPSADTIDGFGVRVARGEHHRAEGDGPGGLDGLAQPATPVRRASAGARRGQGSAGDAVSPGDRSDPFLGVAPHAHRSRPFANRRPGRPSGRGFGANRRVARGRGRPPAPVASWRRLVDVRRGTPACARRLRRGELRRLSPVDHGRPHLDRRTSRRCGDGRVARAVPATSSSGAAAGRVGRLLAAPKGTSHATSHASTAVSAPDQALTPGSRGQAG